MSTARSREFRRERREPSTDHILFETPSMAAAEAAAGADAAAAVPAADISKDDKQKLRVLKQVGVIQFTQSVVHVT